MVSASLAYSLLVTFVATFLLTTETLSSSMCVLAHAPIQEPVSIHAH